MAEAGTEQETTIEGAQEGAPVGDQGNPPAAGEGDPPTSAAPSTTIGDPSDKKDGPGDWPSDWRKRASGDDEDFAKRLDRYRSPEDALKALREAQDKIRSGQTKDELPKDATDEQKAAWRERNGIPDKPEGYLEKLPEGLVIGEADKPLAESFLQAAHEQNMPPEMVGMALDWYYKTQEGQTAAQVQADADAWKSAEDQLRSEWGEEYRLNSNSLSAFLDATAPEGVEDFKAALFGARLPDGTKLGGNPAMLKWLLGVANEINPAGFTAPGSGTSQLSAVEDEIGTIEKTMRENPQKYYGDQKMQDRYRELLDAQEKLSSRAA